MKVYIVFRSDSAYGDLHGSNIHVPTVMVVCSSSDIAEKEIEKLHQIPCERQRYYYNEHEVIE